MNNLVEEFIEERKQRIAANGENENLKAAAKSFNDASNSNQYSYNFSWMGRPIIQYPQDMVAMQHLASGKDFYKLFEGVEMKNKLLLE